MGKYLLLLSFFVTGVIYSQSGNNEFKLPEVLPPSPDVASLTKSAELSATPHTGGANASIPIYQIKVGDYTLPVSLNYNSTGYKPQEIPSRVGLGWSLNAGGCVTRIIRGKPDDYCTYPTTYLTQSQLQAYTNTAYYFAMDLEDQSGYHDSQPDEYRYTVNGLSGKFILKRNGDVLQLPYNNVKISVSKNGDGSVADIFIKDGNGVLYSFGSGQKEYTLQHNLVQNFLQKQNITTAWMLNSISLPSGDNISFSYGTISHYVESGTTESARKGVCCGECHPNLPASPIPCPVDAEYSAKSTLVRYSSKYVSTITSTSGTTISIYYADRPDAGGDNRVDYIVVANQFSNLVKKVQLEYLDKHIINSTAYNEGFFLKKVIVKDPTNSTAEEQTFELNYVDEETNGAGAAPSFNIDHLGYANGADNNTLLPVVDVAMFPDYQIFENIGTADRSPHGAFAIPGMLQKIRYPTDGYDEFYYEPNMKTWWDSVDIHSIVNARLTGNGAPSPYEFYNTYFTPGRNCTGELHLYTEWQGNLNQVPDGDPAPHVAWVRIYDNSTNTLVAWRRADGFIQGAHYQIVGDMAVGLTGGVEYRLELEVRYSSDAWAKADIVYDIGSGKEWKQLKEELCGVRVRKILSFDPVSQKSTNKFYFYKSLFDTSAISANKLYYPLYVLPYQKDIYCIQEEIQCNGYILTSNSATSLYVNEGAGVTYKYVIESDDSTFVNGCIQHNFWTEGQFLGMAIIGSEIPNPPTDMYNYMNGVDTQTVYFNKNMDVVKKIKNYYSIDSRINDAQYDNYVVRVRYEKFSAASPWDQYDFEGIDVVTYPIYTRWDHLDSTVIWEYDLVNSKALKTKQWFTYGNTNNILPTAKMTYASDGSVLKDEMKYSTDLTSQAICSTMVAKNIKDPVLETKSYKDTKLLFQTNTDYKDWFNDGYVIEPELVKGLKGANSQETRLRYYSYDVHSNPIEVSKENDVHITYIWDYNGSLPIAEVTNASWGYGVAYTSFEADGKGGWNFSGTPVTEGSEPAGKKSYLLSNGSITYTGTMVNGKKYYVTYWGKGTPINVNGSAATSVLSKNDWHLYKKLITYSGSGGITVSGSGYVDELRLFPDSAFVKTFTYTPEVGITTSADVNSLYQQAEFDPFNRLLRLRDMDRNILKQYEYKYGADLTGCTNTTANWQATGNHRCAINNVVNNNNTGIKEIEQRDLNNCSATYGQLRWYANGTSNECPVTSSCTGTNKRVINGVCYTGCKQLVSSTYIGNLTWECTYHYYWSQDGFIGPEFQETNSTSCTNPACID
jgi:hypothetical protein